MKTSRRKFLVDTDTASDDAVALVMALRDPSVEVLAITVVAGNVELDQAVQNALYTAELVGADVPVYAGAASPLLQPLHTAQVVHGRDGMGDIGLPVRGRTPASGHAVDRLAELIEVHEPGELTLVTLGPLTNIALLFARHPEYATRLREVVVMGGTADGLGNVTASAEFNIWVDPEAAAIVYSAGARLVQVGWDISRRFAVFDPEQAADLRSVGRLGAVDIQAVLTAFVHSGTHLAGFDLPDPIAMAVALDPTIATDMPYLNVVVETRGEFTRGATVVDHTGYTGRSANTHVVVEASRERFVALLKDRLRESRGESAR
jgi:purine nucleosidase